MAGDPAGEDSTAELQARGLGGSAEVACVRLRDPSPALRKATSTLKQSLRAMCIKCMCDINDFQF